MVHTGDIVETTDRRAGLHVEEGRAVYAEKEQRPEYTTTEQTPSRQTKRRWKGNGSWKTLLKKGEEVAKVQATQEEAEAWANGTLSLDEIRS